MDYLRTIVNKLLILVGAVLLVMLVLNWQYFRDQVLYYINPPESQTYEVNNNDDGQATAEPNRLWIQSLGITAPINYVEEENEDEFQIGLRSGVVHYPDTALPGEFGNAYIFGHSSDMPTAVGDYKTVFALLPKIELDSVIEITAPDGKLYKYKVADKFVVNPDATHLLAQDLSKKQLTLQTSYPIGTALKRYIVVAYLVEE